jgi:tetratricopeptide (TPR) repeat protein
MIGRPRTLAVIGLILGGVVAAANGQDPPAQAQNIDPDAQRLVQVLLGEDWKPSEQAALALERRGVIGARAVLAQRARSRSAREREKLDRVLRDVVNALVVDIQRPLLSPPQRPLAQAALGDSIGVLDVTGEAAITSEQANSLDLESAGAVGREEPKTAIETRMRSLAATGGLVSLGPPALGMAETVPPVRPPQAVYALGLVAQQIYVREVLLLATRAAEIRESYRGRADLAGVVLRAGVEDSRRSVHDAYRAIADDAVALALSDLDANDPDRRECAQDELFRLGELARPALERIAKGTDDAHKTAEAKVSAARLLRRIELKLSRNLIRKIGSELEGYSELPFEKRRSTLFELERLGGADSVPALRELLVVEKNEELQATAAIGLFKEGDVVGAQWLTAHKKNFNRIPTRDLAALILEEGNNYLKIKKYEQAEKDYLQVLDLEPKNEYALYNLACCYSLWGKTEQALVYLKKSIEAGFEDASHMDQDTDLDPIRDDPRFKAMLDALRAKKAGSSKKDDDSDEPGDNRK